MMTESSEPLSMRMTRVIAAPPAEVFDAVALRGIRRPASATTVGIRP